MLSGAPYGYRYVSKRDGGGLARYEVFEDQARVVRQIFDWIGRERLSIGEVCRRLRQQGCPTRRGKAVWDRTTVWGLLRNPAYIRVVSEKVVEIRSPVRVEGEVVIGPAV